MNKYEVLISENKEGTIIIYADTEDEAKDKAMESFNNEDIRMFTENIECFVYRYQP